jgi:hypothetical protein
MKLDVEGHEARVLRGAERILRERRIGALMAEANDYWLPQHGSSRGELLELIRDAGFQDVSKSRDDTYLFVQV